MVLPFEKCGIYDGWNALFFSNSLICNISFDVWLIFCKNGSLSIYFLQKTGKWDAQKLRWILKHKPRLVPAFFREKISIIYRSLLGRTGMRDFICFPFWQRRFRPLDLKTSRLQIEECSSKLTHCVIECDAKYCVRTHHLRTPISHSVVENRDRLAVDHWFIF